MTNLQDGDRVCVSAEVPEGDGPVRGARGDDVGLRGVRGERGHADGRRVARRQERGARRRLRLQRLK